MGQSEIQEIEPPKKQTKKTSKKTSKKNIETSNFFIFIDYLFILVFFGFFAFILLKLVGF